DAGQPAAPPALEPPPRFAERYPPDRAVPGTAWLKAHSVAGDIPEKQSWDLGPSVGVPPAPGGLCGRLVGPPTEQVARIYRIEDKRAREAWRATIGTGDNWLELVPLVSPEGDALTIVEARPDGCEQAICQYEEKLAYGLAMDFGDVLARGCK